MQIAKTYASAASVARHLRTYSLSGLSWHLHWKPVCASTESYMSCWLKEKPLLGIGPRAVFAARQVRGIGQRGRVWDSPLGGVWLSAAMPFSVPIRSPGVFGLAVAVALAERLEDKGVSVRIKWPNDLLVGERKLAGLLPRLIHRGSTVRVARIGLGLNVRNKLPVDGISLGEIFHGRHLRTEFWAAQALLALERAMALAPRADVVCQKAQDRLWAKQVWDASDNQFWQVQGLNCDGALKLRKGTALKTWSRWQ